MSSFVVTFSAATANDISGKEFGVHRPPSSDFTHSTNNNLQDHSVWRPLMSLLTGTPSNELLTVVTSTICNLLLEFSPAKEPMVESGAIELLCQLTKNADPSLRLNGSWALMNMAFQVCPKQHSALNAKQTSHFKQSLLFQSEEHIRTKIINTLGTDRILQLLADPDTRVIMKTLGLLRNLMSKSADIDNIMSEHSKQLMNAVSHSV